MASTQLQVTRRALKAEKERADYWEEQYRVLEGQIRDYFLAKQGIRDLAQRLARYVDVKR